MHITSDSPLTKRCNACLLDLPLTCFNFRKAKRIYYAICKQCVHRKYYLPKREENLKRSRDQYAVIKNDPEKIERYYKAPYRQRVQNTTAEERSLYRKQHPPTPVAEKVRKQRRRARIHGAQGHFTASEWNHLCFTYGYLCLCCGEPKPLQADHITPISRGGDNYISNIQPLCLSCNASKHTKSIDYRLPWKRVER